MRRAQLRGRVFGRAVRSTLEQLEPRRLLSAGPVLWPANAGVVNVTSAPFNAIANDGLDDTAAIQAAVTFALDNAPSRYAAPLIVFIPDGVYNLSAPIETKGSDLGFSNGWRAGAHIFGQSRDGTILRLSNNNPAYQSATTPQAVLRTGSEFHPGTPPVNYDGGNNQAFRHYIERLTVDVGTGNPGAVGIDYIASNRGAIRDVLIRSSDPNRLGYAGITMERNWPGPALIKDVEISGFDFGIRIGHYDYSMTFEHITLRNQRTLGIRNVFNSLAIRGLTSVNAVPVYESTESASRLVIVGGNFTGGNADNPAIINRGSLLVRDINQSGYNRIVDNRLAVSDTDRLQGPSPDLYGFAVDTYVSHEVDQLWASSNQLTLDLPIEETPEFHSNNFANWINVTTFGAVAVNEFAANPPDATAAIQAAIDSSISDPTKQILYLPSGIYRISDTLILRGNIRKIVGPGSLFGPSSTVPFPADRPMLRFDNSGGTGVVLEYLWVNPGREGFPAILHNSSQSLTLRSMDHGGYRNTALGTGKLYVEDVIGRPYQIDFPQTSFFRQVNSEYISNPLIRNTGTMWILGLKQEGEQTVLQNDGGTVELLGGLLRPTGNPDPNPALINNNGQMSAFIASGGDLYTNLVRETRGATTRTLNRDDAPFRWGTLFVSNSQTTLRNATTPTTTLPGLRYNVYESYGDDLGRLPSDRQVREGVINSVNLSIAPRSNYYSLSYEGMINVPADGYYTFHLTADDSAALYIGKDIVVGATGSHFALTRSGTIGLRAGLQPFRVEYAQREGPTALNVEWQSATLPRQAIPAAAFSHAPSNLADNNYIDVTQYPYYALPNDNIDDTAAINQALFDLMGSSRILYFPNGVYNVSDTLDYAFARRSENRMILQGESQAGAIIKLSDNNPRFATPTGNKFVIDTYNGNNGNSFGNYIFDLTIDIGSGNPGASALQFQTNNFGGIRNITLKSSDPAYAGDHGLNIIFNEPGPMIIENLTVTGFDIGIIAGPQQYAAILENVLIQNQRVYGIANYRLPMTINRLTSINSVPAIHHFSSFGWGNIVMTNSSLLGGSPAVPAIRNEFGGQNDAGYIMLRNVTVAGYTTAIFDQTNGITTPTPVGGLITEYTTVPALKANPAGATTSLNLPLTPTPIIAADPMSSWAKVTDFGANPNDLVDDTAAIQRALDSGASTISFPNGRYILSQELIVGGNVKRLEGLGSQIEVQSPLYGSGKAAFKFVPGNQPAIEFRHFQVLSEGGGNWVSWNQATLADLIIKDVEASGYRNSVRGGRIFIEDISGTDLVFDHQYFVGRQINPEGGVDPKIDVIGGQAVIQGLKTENPTTLVRARDRARVEVLGGLTYPVGGQFSRTLPAFVSEDSSISFSTGESRYGGDFAYNIWLLETRNGVKYALSRDPLNDPTIAFNNFGNISGAREGGANINLATGYVPDPTPSSAITGLTAVANNPRQITVSWNAATDAQSGIDGYRILRNGTYIGIAPSTTYVDTAVADATAYTYSIIPINGLGLLGPATASATINTPVDSTRPTLTSVQAADGTVTLTFSEALARTSVQASDFTLTGGLVVGTPLVSRDGLIVTLPVTGLPAAGGSFEVTVTGVSDTSTIANFILPGSLAAFSSPAFSVTGTGTGLLGTYFDNINFVANGNTQTRVDPVIDFNYGFNSAYPGLPGDNFSVRWTGSFLAPTSDIYNFIPRTDDGVRLWIDDQLVVDAPFFQAPTDHPGSVRLEAGRRYNIRMDYFEGGFTAASQLFWQSPTTPRQIIPQQYLFPSAAPATPGGVITATVRTDMGNGADTGLNLIDQASDQGANESNSVHNYNFSNYYHNQIYLRFDLSSLDRANMTIVGADLVGTFTGPFTADIPSPRRLNIFGVPDSLSADNWTETGPGYMRWDTAPGTNSSAAHGNPATSVFLGYIDVDNSGNQLWFRRDGARMTSQALVDFLNSDTNNLATVFIKRQDPWYDNFTSIAMKEHPSMPAPGLVLRMAPKTSATPAAPDLSSPSDTGISNTDNLTRLSNAAPAAALRFTIPNTIPGATVTLFDGATPIASVVATSSSTNLVTTGVSALADGTRNFTARQTLTGTLPSPASAPLALTIDTVAPTLTGAFSRKTHGPAGDFDLPLTLNETAFPTVEPRAGGASRLRLAFSETPVPVDGTLSANETPVIGKLASFGSISPSGNNLIVNLLNVRDGQKTGVRLEGLMDAAGNPMPSGSFVYARNLRGDRNLDGRVSIADRTLVQSQFGAVNALNYLSDLNLSGTVDLADVSDIDRVLGTGLPTRLRPN
jgi:hypothetical protein